MTKHEQMRFAPVPLEKVPTGIEGFDEITKGGLPRGRTTLLVGGPGSGKTVLALNTLVNGARKYGEPGIFVAFEEDSEQLYRNSLSFGWDLPDLIERKLFFVDGRMAADAVTVGRFDLLGMLAGIEAKAEEMSAATEGKPVRVVFDAVDVLLNHLKDPFAEQEEIYRIHEWLASRNLTGLITAKARTGFRSSTLVLEYIHYMADCVIELKRDVRESISNRTLTVVKYRGSSFAENEFNMIIGNSGIQVPSLSIFNLDYAVSTDRVSTGVPELDTMLAGGYLRSSSVLVTGLPGTAKSTLAGAFADSACRRGERALYISYDEGPGEVVRNMASVNIRLEPHVQSGLLRMYSSRAEARNAVEHLAEIKDLIREHRPAVMVIDPLSSMVKAGGTYLAKTAAQRLIYETKAGGVTLLMTSLLVGDQPEIEATPMEISTIADTWIHLSYIAQAGERNRALTIVKSRGTGHSNQVRELVLSDEGVRLAEVYTAGGEVLMGTLRYEKEAAAREAARRRAAEMERKRDELEQRRRETQARLEALQRELESQQVELAALNRVVQRERFQRAENQAEVQRLRGGIAASGSTSDEEA